MSDNFSKLLDISLNKNNLAQIYSKENLRNQYHFDKLATLKKNTFYKKYFDDQRKNYAFNITKVTVMGYIGGCIFGCILLAFSMMGHARLEHTINDFREDKFYKNMTEFKKDMKIVIFYFRK